MHKHDHPKHLAVLTTDIVSAYLKKNVVTPTALVELIGTVQATLAKLDQPPDTPVVYRATQARSVKKKVSRETIICLECGKHFKSLRRHLAVNHKLGAEAYRQKWQLEGDYSMVAPAYSEKRSQLAKDRGLGGTGRR